jgi:transcriptional regulator with GAF, ATPase, and Fis domain
MPGVPQQPVLITLDGNAFLVVRTKTETVDGISKTEIVMSPFEWVKNRLGIKDEDLDFSEDPYGTLKRSYPTSSILHLSDNPEKPVWLLLCGFEGEEINYDNPKLFPIIEMKNKLIIREKLIEQLQAEIERLREENKKLVMMTKEWKEEMKDIVGEKIVTPVPEEYLGLKLSKEGVKRG